MKEPHKISVGDRVVFELEESAKSDFEPWFQAGTVEYILKDSQNLANRDEALNRQEIYLMKVRRDVDGIGVLISPRYAITRKELEEIFKDEKE